MAELHIVGSLIGASDFPSSELTCKYTFQVGDEWKCIEGEESCQTQVDLPRNEHLCIWSHPIDVHYLTHSLQGWPKLVFQVYHQDMFGRNELYGYGFVHVPTTPGTHSLEVVTWRPLGTFSDQLYAYFLGATPQLKNLDMITHSSDRFRLETVTMGKIYLELTVITRNFDFHGVNL